MNASSKLVPLWVRIVVGLMGLLAVAFTLVSGGFAPPGLSADVSAPMNALYLFNSRGVALGVGMLVAAVVGAPEAIATVMIVRFILEIADRVAMSPLYPTIMVGNLLPPLVPALIELVIIITMFRIVKSK
jgi:hypothetical protein